MVDFLGNIGGWFEASPASSGNLAIPFAITCQCGHVLTGERQAQEQLLCCPVCQHQVFVLPWSPWPPPESLSQESFRRVVSHSWPSTRFHPKSKSSFRVFFLLGILVATLIGVFSLWALQIIPTTTPIPHEDVDLVLAKIKMEKVAAEKHLSMGHFSLACEALTRAIQLEQKYGNLSDAEMLRLQRQRQEMAIFMDLVEVPLETIVEHAVRLPGEEWALDFERRYRNKAIILDVHLRRKLDGKVEVNYPLEVRGEPVLLDLESLQLFQQGWPEELKWQRVIFGARLGEVKRPGAGVWRISFIPTSGLLITDPQSLAICCPPLGDEAAKEILKQQVARSR